MNHIYRLIWSTERQTWMVAHEGANARGKPASAKSRLLNAISAVLLTPFAGAALGAPPAINALPTGGQVVAGQASISQATSSMTINQTSSQAIINWQNFNIGANAAVHFQQPGASAVALNRVIGSDPSAIYGSLTATGQVFLVNPSGVLFGPGARVDVGGLVTSTLNIRDDDFLKGNYVFQRQGSVSSVVNQGTITAKYVALLAPEVRNEGIISARMGMAALAAGDTITLGITGAKLVDVQVTKAQFDTLVENKHLVQADGGTVILAAQSANELLGRVVNSGAIEASGIDSDGGVVRLLGSSSVAHSGSINVDAAQSAGSAGKGGTAILLANLDNAAGRTSVSGSISARGGAAGGDGGFIETSASRLSIADTARINTSAVAGTTGKTGEWLLDPTDFTVAATGGDITGAALATALGSGNVTIQTGTGTNTTSDKFGVSGTNGDVFVNDTVSWSANTLTLKAHRDVNVNATMSATGSAGLAVQYGQGAVASGNDSLFSVNASVNLNTTGGFSTRLGSDGVTRNYAIVNTIAALQAIDATGTSVQGNYALGSNLTITGGNWTPIGNTNGPFQGVFEGLGHTISGLANDAAVTDNVGFIGQTTSGALVQNIRVDVTMTGRNAVGGLVGNNQGTIYNAFSTGTVGLDASVGTNTVNGIGGLVGQSLGNILRSRSSVTVSAAGGTQAADLLGGAGDGGIGGLIGAATGGKVSNSYATGDVTGFRNVGGLVGNLGAPIEKSYSTGKVTGTDTDPGNTSVGGLVGFAAVGFIATDSYWDTQASLQSSSAGGATGLTTANLKVAANISSSWDRTRFWKIADGSYPQFLPGTTTASGSAAITINLGDFTRVYGTTPDAGNLTGFSYTGSLLGSDVLSGTSWGTAYTSMLAVGDYAYQTTTNLLAPQFTFSGANTAANYNVSYSNNKLSITPKALTLTGLSAPSSKVYDATTAASVSGTAALLVAEAAGAGTASDGKPYTGDTVAINGTATGTYNFKDAGPASQVTFGGLTSSNGNYTISAGQQSATITPKTLTVTGLSAPSTKVYDATTAASVSGTAALLAAEAAGAGTASDGKPYTGDTVAINGTATGTYNSKDAGPANQVTFSGLSTLNGNYTISAGQQSATISKADLILSGTRVYDATTNVNGDILTARGVGTESFSVGGLSAVGSKDVSVGSQTLTGVSGLTLGTAKSNASTTLSTNYNPLRVNGSEVTITPKALSLLNLGDVTSGDPGSKSVGDTVSVNVSTLPLEFIASGTGSPGDGKAYTGDDLRGNGASTGQVTAVVTETKVGSDLGIQTSRNVYPVSISYSNAVAGNDKSNYTISGTSISAKIAGSFIDVPQAGVIQKIESSIQAIQLSNAFGLNGSNSSSALQALVLNALSSILTIQAALPKGTLMSSSAVTEVFKGLGVSITPAQSQLILDYLSRPLASSGS